MKKYIAAFIVETGSHFIIVNDDNKYTDMCKDVPFIVYNIQDVLKNL